jgi:hypothetical protein
MEEVGRFSVPEGYAADGGRPPIIETSRDSAEALATGTLHEPSDIGTRKTAQRNKAETDILDDQATVDFRSGKRKLLESYGLGAGRLNLDKIERDWFQIDPEEPIGFSELIRVG